VPLPLDVPTRHYARMEDDQTQAAVRAFLSDFVEDRDRSTIAAAAIEPLVHDLAGHDDRFESLAQALASYDGRSGTPRVGMVNQDALAFECRQSLHDLGEHRQCLHDRA
jgi:hypothetical protein